MKYIRVSVTSVLLFIFLTTNIASAYSGPDINSLTANLFSLLTQLKELITQHENLAATTSVANTVTDLQRSCEISLHSTINGVDAWATSTIVGRTNDQFAIGLSIGSTTAKLMYTKEMQRGTFGTFGKIIGTAGYFDISEYSASKAVLDSYAADPRYKFMAVNLVNTNSAANGSTFSSDNSYIEAQVNSDTIGSQAAGKVSISVNVHNCTDTPVPQQNTAKPNILFVLTDDLDMQTMQTILQEPNSKLKALMTDKGLTFENNYTSLSLCCPARTAVLCGQYAHNNGVFTNIAVNADGTLGAYNSFQANGDDKKTVAVTLKNSDYRTALMGKFLNGYSADAGVPYTVPFGWSEWAVGFDGDPYSQYNYTLNANGVKEEHYLPYCTNKGNGKNCEVRTDPATFADRQEHFLLNVLNKKAKDFMTRSSQSGSPFFLYLSPFTPHSPATPAPRYESLFNDSAWRSAHPFPTSAAFNEADVSDKPAWLRDNAGLLKSGNIKLLTELYYKRVISMYAVEDLMEDLIKTLEKNGQLDNTYIVFTSDNGFHLGQHRLTSGKLTEFDTDLHIPLIIRGPKVAAGSKTAQFTANVDIAPTLEALAGAQIPTSVDGRSFKEILLGGKSINRNALLIEHADPATPETVKKLVNSNDERRDTPAQDGPIDGGEFTTKYSGIRTSQYTYVHYAKNDEEELYDNTNDSEQLNNVASVAGAGLMGILRNWTADLAKCKGESCRLIEAENRLNGTGGALDGKACFYGGQQINNGSSRVFYAAAESKTSCDAIKQVRTCNNGILSGDATYNQNSCSVLERFVGINLNRQPQDLNLNLMNQTGATWMRANADILSYYAASTESPFAAAYNFENWQKFIDAHNAGKKGMINIMWDFSRYSKTYKNIPAPGSSDEIKLFAYLDVLLGKLLSSADIIVSGNEPFINTLSPDWAYKSELGGTAIATFYKRATDHIQKYMTARGIRDNHKLYVGAFTNVDGSTMQKGEASQAVKEMLAYASSTSYVDGIDIHTHVKTLAEVEAAFVFLKDYIKKPITDSEYTYVYGEGMHTNESLDAGDTKPFKGLSFAQKYGLEGANTTVSQYFASAAINPVPKVQMDDFFRSRSWLIDNFVIKTNDIFKKYNVYGSTYGFMQTNVNTNNDVPWYMNFLFASTTVKHLPNGDPQGSYQNLIDFISLQKK